MHKRLKRVGTGLSRPTVPSRPIPEMHKRLDSVGTGLSRPTVPSRPISDMHKRLDRVGTGLSRPTVPFRAIPVMQRRWRLGVAAWTHWTGLVRDYPATLSHLVPYPTYTGDLRWQHGETWYGTILPHYVDVEGEGEGKGCRKQGEEGYEEEEKRGRRWRRKEVK